jgi:hypothetical protein
VAVSPSVITALVPECKDGSCWQCKASKVISGGIPSSEHLAAHVSSHLMRTKAKCLVIFINYQSCSVPHTPFSTPFQNRV